VKCQQCDKAVTRETSFEMGGGVLCIECFTSKAQRQSNLTPEERKRLKQAVKEEMGAIVSAATIRQHVEDGYAAILKGGDVDEAINHAVNRIQQTCGLALCEHIADVIRSMQDELTRQMDAIRDQMRKLGSL